MLLADIGLSQRCADIKIFFMAGKDARNSDLKWCIMLFAAYRPIQLKVKCLLLLIVH